MHILLLSFLLQLGFAVETCMVERLHLTRAQITNELAASEVRAIRKRQADIIQRSKKLRERSARIMQAHDEIMRARAKADFDRRAAEAKKKADPPK